MAVNVQLENIPGGGTFNGSIRRFGDKAKRGPVGKDCTWVCNWEKTYTIRGDWDEPLCNGVITFPRGWDRDRFEGDIWRGAPYFGKMYFSNGDIYEGRWDYVTMCPWTADKDPDGVYIFADGERISGRWDNKNGLTILTVSRDDKTNDRYMIHRRSKRWHL